MGISVSFRGYLNHQAPAGSALYRVCEGQVLPISRRRENKDFNHGLIGPVHCPAGDPHHAAKEIAESADRGRMQTSFVGLKTTGG